MVSGPGCARWLAYGNRGGGVGDGSGCGGAVPTGGVVQSMRLGADTGLTKRVLLLQ